MQVLAKPHLLLVTLLLTNSAAMEVRAKPSALALLCMRVSSRASTGVCALQALPIFLDRLVDPITAVALSVTVVLLFGGPACSAAQQLGLKLQL